MTSSQNNKSFIHLIEPDPAEVALRESEERYRQLFEAESDAIFLIENDTGMILEANEAAASLYGYTRQDLFTMRNADLSAEPEQTRNVTHNSSIDADTVVKIPLRYHRKKDGSIFPVEITGRFFYWRGRSVHIAAIRDISERIQSEQTLRESEERYRTIIEQSLQGIAVLQADRIVLVNQAYAEILGYLVEDLLDQSFQYWLQTVHPEDRGMIFQYYRDRLAGKESPSRFVYRLVSRNGKLVWVDAAVNTIQYQGKPAQLSMVLDITERKRVEEALLDSQRQLHNQLKEIQILQVQLREQAIRDSLTGLFNRRYLEETLLREIAQARRTQTAVSVVMLDLDHFKQFNDTYGHQSGDLVLQELGRLLESRFRLGDFPCRYGGEEFVVILPGTKLKDALERAEEIRNLFEQQKFFIDENVETTVTLSAGVSAYPVHGDNPAAILNRADQALYQAKNQGRNRVIAFDV
jgi:diguanylate cyclase (GGDEF)-like protein/PAS domain S-box-containing protein